MPPASQDRGDVFEGTAWYYAHYRKPYPSEFFDRLDRRFGLDGTGRLLDVGCGTGQLAVRLSSRFEELVALDPSAEMVAAATTGLQRAGVANVRLLVMPGEDVSPQLGRFRLAVFGSSLHWMAIDDVLRKCRAVLRPGGGVAIAAMRSIWGGESEWERTVVAVTQKWLGTARRAGSGAFARPARRFEDALTGAGFANTESGDIPCEFDLDIPFIIGHLYSTSYCNRSVLGERAAEFERDLEDTLLAVEPSGRFRWPVEVGYLFADRG